jgi:anti-sigma B factor antagonist
MPAEEHLHIEVERRGRAAVVRLTGELDIATRPSLESTLHAIDGEIVVDLRGLTFLDSDGLQMLLRHRRRPLAVVPGEPRVQRLFEMTDTDRLLRFVEAA